MKLMLLFTLNSDETNNESKYDCENEEASFMRFFICFQCMAIFALNGTFNQLEMRNVFQSSVDCSQSMIEYIV